MDRTRHTDTTRLLVVAAAFVVVVAGMRAAEAILVPFLLSAFIAIISAPPMFWLQRKGLPVWAALLVVMAVILSAALLVSMLAGASVEDFSRQLPEYQERLRLKLQGLFDMAAHMGLQVSSQTLTDYFDPGAAMRMVGRTLSSFGGVLTNAFLILLTVVFILLEAAGFEYKLRASSIVSDEAIEHLDHFTDNVKRYLAIKTGASLVTGLLIAAWLWVLGVDYPLLWGLLAFMFNYVPNIGSIIAAVPALLLAWIQLGTGIALLAGGGYLAVNIVIGSIIEPRFMGRGLGLSTLVVFLSLVFWGWVLGPVGMLLSVPLTMMLKIALENSEEMKGLAVLLGPDPAVRD